MGWKIGPLVEDVPKCVICAAPHTSNWDLIIGELFYTSIGRRARFLIKKEWFFFPFNLIFKAIGGIPVDRSKRASVTDQVAEMFETTDKLQVAITPEGTRKHVEEWKKGFYYIAIKANVPILMAYVDMKNKEIGFKGTFIPTGDVDGDIAKIKSYYAELESAR
jgi:1-acyl-sn-glycerol-3-phosphate acyltransferase